MNCIVPFNKKIKFDTHIAEISSISLEHEITINDDSLLGNFLLSGEYKTHEVSVNTETFNYTLPFDVSLPNNLDKESIIFDIKNFTYEIIDNTYLAIKIEFSVVGDEIQETVIDKEKISFENLNHDQDIRNNDEISNDKEIKEEKSSNIEINKSSVLNVATNSDETFVTYQIHIVKENETLDTICKYYNEPESLVIDYNNNTDIKQGDKIIIPIDE